MTNTAITNKIYLFRQCNERRAFPFVFVLYDQREFSCYCKVSQDNIDLSNNVKSCYKKFQLLKKIVQLTGLDQP